MSGDTWLFKSLLWEREQNDLKTSALGIEGAQFEHLWEREFPFTFKGLHSPSSVKDAAPSTSGANNHPINPGIY